MHSPEASPARPRSALLRPPRFDPTSFVAERREREREAGARLRRRPDLPLPSARGPSCPLSRTPPPSLNSPGIIN